MVEVSTRHTDEQAAEIERIREAVKHLRSGGTMCLADIDALLALLDTLDVYEPPEAPVTASIEEPTEAEKTHRRKRSE